MPMPGVDPFFLLASIMPGRIVNCVSILSILGKGAGSQGQQAVKNVRNVDGVQGRECRVNESIIKIDKICITLHCGVSSLQY